MARRIQLTALWIVGIALPCTSGSAEIEIPRLSAWKDRGIALEPGPVGSWDVRLDGMISPCAAIMKNGRYFLYYIGADGNRSTDGGPRHRALGVATTTDGIRFAKYRGNPIIRHLPHGNEEEGVFSCAASLDEDGHFVLYYGAMDARNSTSEEVNSDIRLATSKNGLAFTDRGTVVSHADRNVWGFGDELFPVGTFTHGGNWYVYYIAKGEHAFWNLGVAWGSNKNHLRRTARVLNTGRHVIGGSDVVPISASHIALFIVRDFRRFMIEVRKARRDDPRYLSQPLAIYNFADKVGHATVLLDQQEKTWFMYQKKKDHRIYVRTAPLSTQR